MANEAARTVRGGYAASFFAAQNSKQAQSLLLALLGSKQALSILLAHPRPLC